ncbi:MAG: TIGR02757 family protein [Bacteroidetes bacterium]|nr:TIGR02757 family protein [Bacteroidota bacterium]
MTKRHELSTAESKQSFWIERLKIQEKYKQNLKDFLDEKVHQHDQPDFIENDPISVPHQYSKKQDIEIAGLIAAVLAWGQRPTIIKKANDFLSRMEKSPHDFLLHHKPKDLKNFIGYKHRTFNETDALYFIEFLSSFYKKHQSLEEAFLISPTDENIGKSLCFFHQLFFSLPDFPQRTKKHIPTPVRKSACKRISMYLRWMVRQDNKGVDFGLWKKISPAQLVCPLDLHVDRVARKLKLIKRKQTDWPAALELTTNLKKLDPTDPVKYDFALFGLGVSEK